MTPAARERLRVRVPVFLISAGAWAVLIVEPGATLSAHCSATMLMASSAPLDVVLALNPPDSLAAAWTLMLAAMMAPLLVSPLRHIHDRSLSRRRSRSIALFIASYAAVWMVAGVLLFALALGAQLIASESFLAVMWVTISALIWQFSPVKQRCLNRCHAHSELAAFGSASDIAALRFGLTHGLWCVGSCWMLMLLPSLVSHGHVAAMAGVSLWLFAERLERPTPPRWRLRAPVKAVRILIAQRRLRLGRIAGC